MKCTLDLGAQGIHPEWSSDIPHCVTTCPQWDAKKQSCPLTFNAGKICEPAVAEMRRCFVAAQLVVGNLAVENALLKSRQNETKEEAIA